jgi:hypothetical protein
MNEIHDHKMTPTNGCTSVIGSSIKSSRNKAVDRTIHQVICNEVALVDRCVCFIPCSIDQTASALGSFR